MDYRQDVYDDVTTGMMVHVSGQVRVKTDRTSNVIIIPTLCCIVM